MTVLSYLPTYFVLYFRLPIYILEAGLTAVLTTLSRLTNVPRSRLARFLPFRYHEFIYFELPGLRSFLVGLGSEHEQLAAELIAEALETVGQKRAARLALIELQARGLEDAARNRHYAATAALDLPFLTDAGEGSYSPLAPFRAAAEDLRAAATSGYHSHRGEDLRRARKTLERAELAITEKRRPSELERRLQPVLRLWRGVVRDEQAALAREQVERPQIPVPFVAGPVLEADGRRLFRGRADLVRLIDEDLSGERRGLIWLFGQRRMGKSSLIHMLPVQLGTGTAVAVVDFQRLSGSPHRGRAYRWIAEEVAGAWPEAPPPPEAGDAWVDTLAWLAEVDAALAAAGRRLLVAVDEVERLEDGIRAGWATSDLLDFLRAAGDALHRVRFLLAGAYRPRALGGHWSDRLINLRIRELRRLSRADAEDLVRRPVSDFPDIYPQGGVERILQLTAGHPYLTQLVCDRLCRHLNAEGRLVAGTDDLERAIDDAFLETTLFDELWDKRTDAQRRVLEALAAGDRPAAADRRAARELEREDYVERRGGRPVVAVPMFADWIADRG